MLRNF